MATIRLLKPGQIVWSVETGRMGNTMMREQSIFKVLIKEVREDSVVASWNGNAFKTYDAGSVKGWKVKEPKRKPNIFDMAREAMKPKGAA